MKSIISTSELHYWGQQEATNTSNWPFRNLAIFSVENDGRFVNKLPKANKINPRRKQRRFTS
jgi:hypothetical protein